MMIDSLLKEVSEQLHFKEVEKIIWWNIGKGYFYFDSNKQLTVLNFKTPIPLYKGTSPQTFEEVKALFTSLEVI